MNPISQVHDSRQLWKGRVNEPRSRNPKTRQPHTCSIPITRMCWPGAQSRNISWNNALAIWSPLALVWSGLRALSLNRTLAPLASRRKFPLSLKHNAVGLFPHPRPQFPKSIQCTSKWRFKIDLRKVMFRKWNELHQWSPSFYVSTCERERHSQFFSLSHRAIYDRRAIFYLMGLCNIVLRWDRFEIRRFGEKSEFY